MRAERTSTSSPASTTATSNIGRKNVASMNFLPHAFHFQSYAFHGNNVHIRADFPRRIGGLGKLGAPFFAAHFDDAAIALAHARGEHSSFPEHRIHVGCLVLHI